MVPNTSSNFAHRARSSQVNMLCIIDKYRLWEFYLNALVGQKGDFCDLMTLGQLYKIHHIRQFKRASLHKFLRGLSVAEAPLRAIHNAAIAGRPT